MIPPGHGSPSILLVDGVRCDPDLPVVTLGDRGFLYGEGAFETLRTYGGRPFAVADHLELLQTACRAFTELPLDPAAIDGDLHRAAAARAPDESVLRVMVSGSAAEIGLTAAVTRLRIYITAYQIPPPPTDLRGRGADVVTRAPWHPEGLGLPWKSLSFLPSLAAVRWAQGLGADEAMAVRPSGELLEGATSNVLVVREGALVTPRDGIRAGVTRRRLLQSADALGLRAEARIVLLDELSLADAVFLASTLREIVPVRSIDGQPVPMRFPVGRLLAALRAS